MKLEYLPDGSDDCPLSRVYDFDPNQALELQRLVECLADGSRDNLSVHELPFVTSVDDCQLVFNVGERDLGIANINRNRFSCLLTRASWENIVGLMGPFCIPETSNGFQWLDETSEISLLLSPDGLW